MFNIYLFKLLRSANEVNGIFNKGVIDQIFGNKGDDQLYGNRGDDWLFGGPGADQFIFGSNSGHDVISDFNLSSDLVLLSNDVNGSGIGSGAEALARLSQSDAGAVLDLGAGHSVTFAGLDIGQLGEDDFAFF